MGQRLNCTDCINNYVFMGCVNDKGTGKKETCPYFVDSTFGDILAPVKFVENDDGTERSVDATIN